MPFVRCCIAIAAIFVSISVPSAWAQTAGVVRRYADGTVTVKASHTPVQSVLEELLASCALDVRIDAKAAARLVTIEVADVDPAAALSEVLRGAGLDFAMHARCGTIDKPALVIVSQPGGGPLMALAPPVSREERLPPVPAIPSAAPSVPQQTEEEAQRASLAQTAAARDHHELAPGEVTGTMLAERLRAMPPSNDPVIELPFTDQNGEPYRQIRPAESRTTATLPFPDARGNVVVVPLPQGPQPQTAGFPVYKPGATSTARPSGEAPSRPESQDLPQARKPGGGL